MPEERVGIKVQSVEELSPSSISVDNTTTNDTVGNDTTVNEPGWKLVVRKRKAASGTVTGITKKKVFVSFPVSSIKNVKDISSK